MSRNQSHEEIRESHLSAMGHPLGGLYHALYNEVVWLHAKWLEFRKLYAHSPKRIDLLNETAGFFFRVIEDVLWEDILLHLARLTDPPKTAGKENLTLLRLPSEVTRPAIVAHLEALVAEAEAQASFARQWRHRHLAHRDLGLALNSSSQPLPGVSRDNVESALSAFRHVLNRISAEYLGEEIGFEHFLAHDDAEALVYHLRVSKQTENRRQERLRQHKPLPEDFEPPPEA